MKKILLLTLLALSSVTFAKDFNPDLLIGKWQCKGAFSNPDSFGTETYTETYKKDGTIESKNVIKEINGGQKNTVTMQTLGQWRVEGDIISINLEKLLKYHASNKAVEARDKTEEALREDRSFYDYKLIELTKNNYVFTQMPEDEQDNYRFKYACHRLKK